MTQKATFETARISAEALSGPAAEEPVQLPSGHSDDQIDDSAAERLDRYELRRKLNKGGFATVYEAYDPRIKRSVAVKKCSSLDEENHERFFREAEIAGNLSHPNIVRIFDFGVADGIPFIVQELLGGKDLTDWIESGLELSTYDRVRILLQVADGLAYAHSRDVIHRDVKPANVRVLEDGSIKLLDFGVAAIQEAPSELTQAGTTVGTAAYLAPEQIRGERPSRATDLFSFGVTAYELLSGHRPFEGETLSAVLYQIAHQQPDELPAGAIPNRLVRLVHRCLAKQSQQRPEDFAEVVTELENVLRDPRLAPPSADTVPIETDARQSLSRQPPSAFRPESGRHRVRPLARVGPSPAPPATPRPVPEFSELRLDGRRAPLRDSSTRIQVARPRKRRGKLLVIALLALVGAVAFVGFGGPLPEPVAAILSGATSRLPPEVRSWLESSRPGQSTELLSTRHLPEPAPVVPETPEPVETPASTAESLSEGGGPTPDPVTAAVAALAARRERSDSPAPAPASTPRRRSSSAPATVFLPPSWNSQMMVSIDGGAFQALDRRRMRQLGPGSHKLTFWLNTTTYQARRTVDLELEPSETRTIESPLAPPAALDITLEPANVAGRVEIDGRSVELPLRELQVLEPGNHRLTFHANPADPLGPLTKIVDLQASTVHEITFDLRRRRALLEPRGAFDWDG